MRFVHFKKPASHFHKTGMNFNSRPVPTKSQDVVVRSQSPQVALASRQSRDGTGWIASPLMVDGGWYLQKSMNTSEKNNENNVKINENFGTMNEYQ